LRDAADRWLNKHRASSLILNVDGCAWHAQNESASRMGMPQSESGSANGGVEK
jgi:hypothetical protein